MLNHVKDRVRMGKAETGDQGSAAKRYRRLGRPPGTPESVRRIRVVTLMTDAESEKLTKIAGKQGKSVSALVHEVLFRFIQRQK